MSLKESYDSIATVYQASKKLPFRKYVEEYTLFQLLGDLQGKKVLDLACGGGHYSRLLKERGASKVVGVDISPLMVQLAEEQEKLNPIGCSYICSDAADIDVIEHFDFVIGIYLFCNSETKEKMTTFAKNVRKNLKTGGKFVGVEKLNLQNPHDELSAYHVYHEHKVPLNDGDRLGISFHNPDGTTFELQTYYWKEETYEEAFINAGFKSVTWEGPWVDSNLPDALPTQYWDTFLRAKGLSAMVAVN